MFGRLVHEPPHVCAADLDAENQLGCALRPEQIDFSLSRARDVDVGRLMIERVDDKTEATRTVNHDHDRI